MPRWRYDYAMLLIRVYATVLRRLLHDATDMMPPPLIAYIIFAMILRLRYLQDIMLLPQFSSLRR